MNESGVGELVILLVIVVLVLLVSLRGGVTRKRRPRRRRSRAGPQDKQRPQHRRQPRGSETQSTDSWAPEFEYDDRLRAKVLRVIDGDTVIVNGALGQLRVRLDAIDCPEDDQPWGNTAKAGLIKIIGGREVELEVHGLDHHGRTLATIYIEHHETRELMNVNERMVMLGHAWVMRMYYNHLPDDRKVKLNQLERWARSKKVGLWRTSDPIPPWKWRRGAGEGTK